MADKITQDTRSKVMKSIRSISKQETHISKALWKKGLRFRRNVKDLFGKPDISIKKYKIVVFLDSCFWHSCPIHGHMPKSNLDYWSKKLLRNIERDIKVNNYYNEKEWVILRFWEHQVKGNVDNITDVIISQVIKQRNRLI